MESLPVEVLLEIFSYLRVRDFLIASEVCHTFNSIVNSKTFMRKICADITNAENFQESTREYVNLKIENAKNKQLKIAHENLSTLVVSAERLKLDNIEIVEDVALDNFITNFHNLRELHMEGISKKSTLPAASQFIRLPHLKVLKFFYSTNDLLQPFGGILDQLEVLKVCLIPHENEQNKFHNHQFVTNILQNNRTSLQKLNFYEVNFDDQFLDQISMIRFKRLSKFSMSFNSYLSPESPGFERFVKRQGPTMEKFKIRTFDHINEHHLKLLIENAVNIRSLNLIICSYCDYESFSDFKNLSKLEKLKIQPTNYCSIGNLSYEIFVSDKILSHRNENMKHISIEMLPLTVTVTNKIINAFPFLITLQLSSASETELRYAQQLRIELKLLKKLVLNGENFIEIV